MGAAVESVAWEGGRARVALSGGKVLSIRAAAPEEPVSWVSAKTPYAFGDPVLFVPRPDADSVGRAVAALAADMGGYWLRYYDSTPHPGPAPKPAAFGTAAWRGGTDGHGVVEAVLKDGREFSILAATPEWFAGEFARLKLPYYFGPCVLFLKRPDAACARAAAKAMAAAGEGMFCRYDTPRSVLPEVLERFKAAHN